MRSKTVARFLLAFSCAALAASGQDSVEVDPEHHQVEFENDQIRVVRMTYPVGYKTPMHSHLPGVTVMLSSAKVHSWDKSGEESDTGTEAGNASWSDGGSVHSNQVMGETPLELVRVEIKRKGTSRIPTPSHDVMRVDPEHHEIVLENDQVRVIRAKYPAGYETPLHNHLPGVGISLTGGRSQATFESGRKGSDAPIPRGNVSSFNEGGELHRTKVLGEATDTIRVEVKSTL